MCTITSNASIKTQSALSSPSIEEVKPAFFKFSCTFSANDATWRCEVPLAITIYSAIDVLPFKSSTTTSSALLSSNVFLTISKTLSSCFSTILTPVFNLTATMFFSRQPHQVGHFWFDYGVPHTQKQRVGNLALPTWQPPKWHTLCRR